MDAHTESLFDGFAYGVMAVVIVILVGCISCDMGTKQGRWECVNMPEYQPCVAQKNKPLSEASR